MQNDWLKKLKKLLGSKKDDHDILALKPSSVKHLVQALQRTQEQELNCEEAFDLIDQYVELTLQGENTQELLPLVHHHLEMCRDCREEYETLRDILLHVNQE